MELREALYALNADVLKALAQRVGIAKPPARKGEIAAVLENYLQNHLAEWLELMSSAQRSFLAEAAHRGGRVDPDVFDAKYDAPCPRQRAYLSPQEVHPINLVLQDDHDGVGIPDAIARTLRPLLPTPPPLRIQTAAEIPESVELASGQYCKKTIDVRKPILFLGEPRAAAELRRVLALAQQGKLKATPKSGRPTEAAVRLIGASLAVPDFALETEDEGLRKDRWHDSPGAVRAHAWGVLIQQCGWCKKTGETLAPTAAGKGLLSGFDPPAYRDGFNRFLADDHFDEFNRIANIKGQTGRAKREMTPPSQRKRAIVNAMRHWPVGGWIAFDHIFRCIRALGYRFGICGDLWRLYIADPEYGSMGYNHVGDSLERQYLRAFLMESMATLGLIDIAYTFPHGLWLELRGSWGTDDLRYLGRYDGLLYARLNPLGAFCLGMRDAYEGPPQRAAPLLRVLPTRDIVFLDRDAMDGGEIALMERMARRTGDLTWRLDEGCILEHVEAGGTLKELTEFLERSAKDEIPQTVRVWFDDLTRHASAIVGREDAFLVELRDEATALLVAHDSRAGKCCRHAGGAYLAVPRRNENAFRSAVKALGMILPY